MDRSGFQSTIPPPGRTRVRQAGLRRDRAELPKSLATASVSAKKKTFPSRFPDDFDSINACPFYATHIVKCHPLRSDCLIILACYLFKKYKFVTVALLH